MPVRDPEATRKHLLEVTANEMLLNGYKAASLSDILDKAGVSKGALYHHFANKQELGYAVFEEVYIDRFLTTWEIPMSQDDPVQALSDWFRSFAQGVKKDELELGCPVCNIATEMSSVDEGFRHKAMAMYAALGERIVAAITAAKEKNLVRSEIKPRAVATFLVAAIQGVSIQGKYSRNVDTFRSSMDCMADYVNSLRSVS